MTPRACSTCSWAAHRTPSGTTAESTGRRFLDGLADDDRSVDFVDRPEDDRDREVIGRRRP